MTMLVGPNTVAQKPHGSLKLFTTLASSRSPSETLVMISPCPGSWWNCRSISSKAAAASEPGAFSRLWALEASAKFDGTPAVEGGWLPPAAMNGSTVPAGIGMETAWLLLTRKSGDAYTTAGDWRRAVTAWRTEAPVRCRRYALEKSTTGLPRAAWAFACMAARLSRLNFRKRRSLRSTPRPARLAFVAEPLVKGAPRPDTTSLVPVTPLANTTRTRPSA